GGDGGGRGRGRGGGGGTGGGGRPSPRWRRSLRGGRGRSWEGPPRPARCRRAPTSRPPASPVPAWAGRRGGRRSRRDRKTRRDRCLRPAWPEASTAHAETRLG